MKSKHLGEEGKWETEQYQLLDFGEGRKLERFGRLVLDRPSPAATRAPKTRAASWSRAHVVLGASGNVLHTGEKMHVSRSNQEVHGPSPSQPIDHEPWQVGFGDIVFNLKLTPYGHVGLFPEQWSNWNWLSQRVVGICQHQPKRPPMALNLFGYTGGTTLALAAAGASVVHVDASMPAVAWARRNAESSGLADKPIRWITEDARKFVARELRRGKRYDLVVMDPPSYGHGPSGKAWSIASDLPDLLSAAVALLSVDGPASLLITGHSETPSPEQICSWIAEQASACAVESGRLQLLDPQQRGLDAGFFVKACF